MAGEIVPPLLGAKSFNCPHCSAVAHQTWISIRGCLHPTSSKDLVNYREKVEITYAIFFKSGCPKCHLLK